MNYFARIVASVSLGLIGTSLFAQTNQVCLTIDDLPLQRPGLYDAARQKEITGSMLSSLIKYKIPAIGFVNENKLYTDGKLNPDRVKLLVQWLENGMELGNHTFSHPDYNDLTFNAFKDEIQKGQEIIGKLNALEIKLGEHDQTISVIFEYLKELEIEKKEDSDFKSRRRIGFQSNKHKSK